MTKIFSINYSRSNWYFRYYNVGERSGGEADRLPRVVGNYFGVLANANISDDPNNATSKCPNLLILNSAGIGVLSPIK